MKQLLPTGDSLANKISFYHLLLLMASLPFNFFFSHLILMSFGVHTIIQFNKQNLKPVFTWRTLLLQSVFLVTIISTIYTINKPEAYNEWGKQLTILLFPLLFCFTGLDIKRYRPALLLGFSLVCTATIAYLFYDALHTIRYYKMPLTALFSAAFTNHNFSEPIDIHATFFSMQLVIALVYLAGVVVKERNNYYRFLYAVCILILWAGLFQLCAKSVIFCLFAILTIVLPWFLLTGSRRWKFMIVAVFASVALIAGIFQIKAFRERYVTDLQVDLSAPKAGETTDPRLARWETASGLIKQSPLIGHGAGSEIGLLHQQFFIKKYYSSFLNNLNVHNEYLSFMLKSGLLGLLIYLATLAFGFRQALKAKDMLFFSFMLLLVFVSFSENFLDVDKGIFFYAFFFSFFVFSNDKERKNSKRFIAINNEPLEHNYLEEPATI